jgi:hypothetical protein
MTDNKKPETTTDIDHQEKLDELSAKLDYAAAVVGDLLKVFRAYGERGTKAVYLHTEQLTEDQMRHTITAMVTYLSVNNSAVAAMFQAGAAIDGEALL